MYIYVYIYIKVIQLSQHFAVSNIYMGMHVRITFLRAYPFFLCGAFLKVAKRYPVSQDQYKKLSFCRLSQI